MNYTSTLFLPKSLALGNVVVINGKWNRLYCIK